MTRDDPGEHVAQVGLRIDPVHLAGFDERGDDRPMLAAAGYNFRRLLAWLRLLLLRILIALSLPAQPKSV